MRTGTSPRAECKIGLDTQADDHLPEFGLDRQITVRMLLISALMSGKFLPAPLPAEMRTPHPTSGDHRYGINRSA